MKRVFSCLSILIGFYACKSNSSKYVPESIAIRRYESVTSVRKLKKEFMPIIQGVWVKADYVDKVAETKSPLAAADLVNYMTTFYINTTMIKGDSLSVPVGWGNHDGTTGYLYFRPGKIKSTIILNGRDMGYIVKNRDTILMIHDVDDHKQPVTHFFYRALKKQPDDNLGYGMDYIINKRLIAGTYLSVDNTGSASKVFFSDKGLVSGFLGKKTYYINIDLNSDEMDNLDEITFDQSGKSTDSFSFKFVSDSLKLYSTKPNKDSTKLVLNKLQYTLIRQTN